MSLERRVGAVKQLVKDASGITAYQWAHTHGKGLIDSSPILCLTIEAVFPASQRLYREQIEGYNDFTSVGSALRDLFTIAAPLMISAIAAKETNNSAIFVSIPFFKFILNGIVHAEIYTSKRK